MSKLLHIIVIGFLSLILMSCEQLGIEEKTVKGEWQSMPYADEYIKLFLANDVMTQTTYSTDGTEINTIAGTWKLHKDTLNLYKQDIESGGKGRFVIEQMSMNTLTLRNLKNNDTWIMYRVYPPDANNYDTRLMHVFNLKKGFLWYCWQIFGASLCMVIAGLIIGSIIQLLSKAYAFAKPIVEKIKKKNKNK